MKKNVGKLDGMLRVVAAVVILVMFANGRWPGSSGITVAILAIAFGITGVVRRCPLYRPFGIDTQEAEEQK